jgi:hypothetical protein
MCPVRDFSFLIAYCIPETRAGLWDLVVDSVDIVFLLMQSYSVLGPVVGGKRGIHGLMRHLFFILVE